MENDLVEFIKESNKIEGILREPTLGEITAHEDFLNLDRVCVSDLENFVEDVAGAALRDKLGMNVRVGKHLPPIGGPKIVTSLERILVSANSHDSPLRTHKAYERLHPFMDGNGRSGRVMWLWMMDEAPLGFLHTWYYQSL